MRHFIVILALLTGAPSAATAQNSGMEVIQCWDTTRGIVQPTRRRACSGREVSAADAVELKARYDARRHLSLTRAEAVRQAEASRAVGFHSAGTGFAINDQGAILTSAHVVHRCDVVELRVPNATRRLPVRIRAMDETNDLALLDTPYRTSATLRLAPHLPAADDPVAVIGYPQEGHIRLTPRLTPAQVSYDLSDPRKRGLVGVIGDVRRGHSGGPVLDSKGRVIGVLKAKIDSVAAHRINGTVLKHLGVVTEARAVAAFLEKARTPHSIDGTLGRERSVGDLRRIGTSATVRLDCLRRR
jgi:S1-C subfamily serine protease